MAESPHNPLDPEQHEDESPTRRRIRLIGLFAGPALGLLAALALPDAYAAAGGMVAALGFDAKVTAGLAVWMAIWWMTESIPVYATALLPLAVLPATGAVPIDKVAPNYAKDLIFLFMGGFMLALGMQRWGLHRRIALTALRLSGTGPRRVVGGFMVITALLSMWVSNTATTLMMMPIAASVAELFDTDDSGESAPGCGFGVCLLLGIAYAASIGGLGTMIGSPPNLVAVSYLQKNLGIEITFAQWMMVGVPIVAVFCRSPGSCSPASSTRSSARG
ncbi:MAG: SLC13 family permease [Verrucomicrobiales bacterium]